MYMYIGNEFTLYLYTYMCMYMYMHVYIGALGMKERRNSIVQDLKSIVKDIEDVSYISTSKFTLNYTCKNCVQTTLCYYMYMYLNLWGGTLCAHTYLALQKTNY